MTDGVTLVKIVDFRRPVGIVSVILERLVYFE